ncbi:MAG TPA: invasion associated locus B family protein [Amaricoccus sp.]|nr:invasion associated locus B family protein [Amaricoccus sp.]
MAPALGGAQEAADQPATPAPPPKWMISCSNQLDFDELRCEISQSIVVSTQAGQSQRVAVASFIRAVGETETEARLLLPYDVSLRDAVTVSVDEAALGTLAWLACDVAGCYAGGPVPDTWAEALRAGNKLAAALKTRDGRDVTFTFTLEDFSRISDLMP